MNKKRGFLSGKRGQIWIETVIYTLIAFSLIGLVLAFVVPKINETQDKGVIDQTLSVLQNIDTLIRDIGDPGNQRLINLGINKGEMTVDSLNDEIFFIIDSRYKYSEPGKEINIGKVLVDTETKGEDYIVTMTLNYSGQYNLTYQGIDLEKTLTSSSVPYSFSISNVGKDGSGKTIIDTGVVG